MLKSCSGRYTKACISQVMLRSLDLHARMSQVMLKFLDLRACMSQVMLVSLHLRMRQPSHAQVLTLRLASAKSCSGS
eukprot:599975-Pelagomonas_calceolata.AAC.11